MSGMFRREGSEVVLDLADVEREILDDLARQVVGLLEPEHARPDDPLEALVGIGPETELPDDPALARLLPDGILDDPEAAAEFRRFTEVDLRQRKTTDALQVRRSLTVDDPDGPGESGEPGEPGLTVRLDDDQARHWLGFLNDVRLVLGTRLAVTEEPVELADDDPRLPVFSLYGWLGVLQETLVESLVPRHP